jgi:ATP-dependent protease HslVU (ClpYQ) peptidase subunit
VSKTASFRLNGDVLVAGAGVASEVTALEAVLGDYPELVEPMSDTALRVALAFKDVADNNHESGAIVAGHGTHFYVSGSGDCLEINERFLCLGSGAEFAYGFLAGRPGEGLLDFVDSLFAAAAKRMLGIGAMYTVSQA